MFEHFLPKQPPRSRVERARDQFSIYSRPFFNFEPRPELKKKNLELYSRTTTENVTGIESEKQNGYLCLHSSVKSTLRSRVQRARSLIAIRFILHIHVNVWKGKIKIIFLDRADNSHRQSEVQRQFKWKSICHVCTFLFWPVSCSHVSNGTWYIFKLFPIIFLISYPYHRVKSNEDNPL